MKNLNKAADVFPEMAFGGFSRCDGTLAVLLRAHALAPSAGVVLDIGCGRGEGFYDECAARAKAYDFRAQGRRVIGIDVGLAGNENPIIDEFRYIGRDGSWPVESSSIDLAVCRSVIEHVPNIPGFFFELSRVLKPGGYFAAHTSNILSYPGVAAWLVPNRYHGAAVSMVQNGREERDVFPTLYKCNTVWKLRRALRDSGGRVWNRSGAVISAVFHARVSPWCHALLGDSLFVLFTVNGVCTENLN